MSPKELNDTVLIELLNRQFGTKTTVMYYLRRAKDASGRARVAIVNQNQSALGSEAQAMIDNVEMLYKILGDDTKLIDKE